MENPSYQKPEFDEEKFISEADSAQKELLSGARQYLFDFEEYVKGLGGTDTTHVSLAADSLRSAIECAAGGSVLDAKAYLGDAKYFNVYLPESIIRNTMEAARWGGRRNFVRNVHACGNA